MFCGGALDSQITDSQFVDNLLEKGKTVTLNYSYRVYSLNIMEDTQAAFNKLFGVDPKLELEGASILQRDYNFC